MSKAAPRRHRAILGLESCFRVRVGISMHRPSVWSDKSGTCLGSSHFSERNNESKNKLPRGRARGVFPIPFSALINDGS